MVQFIVIGLDLRGRPNPKVDKALSILGAVELTRGVWIVGTDKPAAEIGDELSVHLASDQKLKVLEAAHGGWTGVLDGKVLMPRSGKSNSNRTKP